MNVLVTGGAGYIGSVVVEQLVGAGHRVVVIDDLSTGHIEAVDPAAHFVHGDVGDRGLVRRTCRYHKIECVIHMAGYATIATSVPETYYVDNTIKGVSMLQGALDGGVQRFVLSSTAAVYGARGFPSHEECECRPINPYGRSKLMLEQIMSDVCEEAKAHCTIFRYFNVAGASRVHGEDHEHETHLIPNILRAARDGVPVKVLGDDHGTRDGTCVRDFVHVVDLAEAHVRATTLDGINVLNLGGGQPITILEVIRTARVVLSLPITFEVAPARPGDPPYLAAEAAKAERDLKWKARRGLADMIDDAWAWMKKHPNGYRATVGQR